MRLPFCLPTENILSLFSFHPALLCHCHYHRLMSGSLSECILGVSAPQNVSSTEKSPGGALLVPPKLLEVSSTLLPIPQVSCRAQGHIPGLAGITKERGVTRQSKRFFQGQKEDRAGGYPRTCLPFVIQRRRRPRHRIICFMGGSVVWFPGIEYWCLQGIQL